jgi:hypothetical protein
MSKKTGVLHGMMPSLVAVVCLGGCAPTEPSQPLTVKPGTGWREVAEAGGAATVKFSYLTNGRKYDLATLKNSPNPVVFENSRLFAILPPDGISGWERLVEEHLKTVDLPFESGVGPFHSWLLAQGRIRQGKSKPQESITAGDVAEGAVAAVILAPVAPILLAGGVAGASEYAMTGGDRQRAQAVNEALLDSTGSYGGFLKQFDKSDFQTAKGNYEIREYLATRGAFFTGRDYYYEVGFRDGKPVWASYRNETVRLHTVRYWESHH